MESDNEKWPWKISEAAKRCHDTCRDAPAAAFFKGFVNSMEPVKPMGSVGKLAHGNRTFMARALERGLLAAAEEMKLKAKTSPALVWQNPELEFVKKLDVLIWSPGRKCVAVEIKGRGFDGIASALAQFELARKHAEYLTVGKGLDRFSVSPSETHFMLVLGDSNARSQRAFDLLRRIHHDENTSFAGIFLDTDVNSENIEGICGRAKEMTDHIARLTNPCP